MSLRKNLERNCAAARGPGSERLGVGAAMRPPPTGSAVYVFLGVGHVGARRFLRTEAQGVDSGAQGEETSSISIRLGVRTS